MKKAILPFLLLAALVIAQVVLPSITCSLSGSCDDDCTEIDRGRDGDCTWIRYHCATTCRVGDGFRVVREWEKTVRECD
jgi:hypothetical protein